VRRDVNDQLLDRWRQPLGVGVEPVENAGFVIDVLDLDTASVSLNAAPAHGPRRSRRGRIWMVVSPLCATPFDIYKRNAISTN
jgi:hypothetical protein